MPCLKYLHLLIPSPVHVTVCPFVSSITVLQIHIYLILLDEKIVFKICTRTVYIVFQIVPGNCVEIYL